MSVMPHEPELRQVNDINYNILGKTDESGLMPTRSRRLKTESLDANTIQKKKELNDVIYVIESDDGRKGYSNGEGIEEIEGEKAAKII